MTSLILLALCAAVPWTACALLRASFLPLGSVSAATHQRALVRFRRATLFTGTIALPASAMAGALLVDPALSTRWPSAGSWFFASLCMTTACVSLALARRTPEEAATMSHLETIGRAVQMAALPVLATGLSLTSRAAVELLLPSPPAVRVLAAALVSVVAVIVVSPWLVMTMRLWRIFPRRVEANRVFWRLAHLPAPTPLLTHAAALPWLRTALVSDGLFHRAPDRIWQALVRYELGGSTSSRVDRAARWTAAISCSLVVFVASYSIGTGDPRKLVAATCLAVFFTGAAAWLANREPSSKLALDSQGPSMQEIAQALRSLPPCDGQAFPRTSRKPLGSTLYDRLFALGHDPGRRPNR
jgi:hypothetical protein